MIQLYRDNAKEIERLEAQLAGAERALTNVEDITLRHLLELRYMDGKPWNEVAKALKYDERWVLRLHRKALNALRLAR